LWQVPSPTPSDTVSTFGLMSVAQCGPGSGVCRTSPSEFSASIEAASRSLATYDPLK
jgi:hypothetical protein